MERHRKGATFKAEKIFQTKLEISLREISLFSLQKFLAEEL